MIFTYDQILIDVRGQEYQYNYYVMRSPARALEVERRCRSSSRRCPERFCLAYTSRDPTVLAEFLLVVNLRPEIAVEMFRFDHRQRDIRLN